MHTIGLLTPYTGDNLGDQAIQTAFIHNLQEYRPRARIYGLTLYPQNTQDIHNIQCYPLTSFSFTGGYRIYTRQPTQDNGRNKNNNTTVLERVKVKLRKVQHLYILLRNIASLVRRLGRPLIVVLNELLHVLEAYKICKKTDLLIVSGGGQLDDSWGGAWGHPYSLFKWALLARSRGAKFLVISVGVGGLDAMLSRFFVKITLSLAAYCSYRDERSKSIIEHLGIKRKSLVYPDLAYSIPRPAYSNASRASTSKAVIGVSPIAYCDPRIWPRKNEKVYKEYVHKLAMFVSSLVSKGHLICLFATDRPDIRVIDDMMVFLDRDAHAAIRRDTALTLDDLFRTLDAVDLVVASRLHGVLLSHVAGKPVLAISYESKVDTLMGDMGQSQYCVSIDNLDASFLIETFAHLRSCSDKVGTDIRTQVATYRQELKQQYDYLAQTY